CPHCRVEGTPDVDAWRALTHGWDLAPPQRVYVPTGCLECRNTGYLGRTGVYEMMTISPPLDLAAFNACALAEGMRPLRISASAQIARGITTIEEVMGVLPAE